MIIKIVVGNMFDYPANYLLVGSSVRGHCEKPTSNVMQVLTHLEQESLNEYSLANKTLQKYGTGKYYACVETSPFNLIFIGYPGTGHQESFEDMLYSALLQTHLTGFITGMVTVTMPLIGTNVGGLSLEEWVESFNKVLTKYNNHNVKFVQEITIVCKTDEQAKFLSDKIVLTYPPAI